MNPKKELLWSLWGIKLLDLGVRRASDIPQTQGLSTPKPETLNRRNPNIRASIIRIGFWGPLYYIYNEGPPQNSIGDDYKAPKLQKPTIDYD